MPGQYEVKFELPTDYAFIKQGQGSDVNKDSNADVSTDQL